MTELDYLGALVRHWKVIAIATVSALIATLIITALQDRVYETSAHLIVAPATGTRDTSDVIRSVETLDRRTVVATFARMTSTPGVQRAIAASLRITPEQAAGFDTRASVVPNTNVIRISVSGPDPQLAAKIANAAANFTARQAEALYRIYALRILSEATAPEDATYPDPLRNLTIGLALGLFIGIAAALALERFRGDPTDETLWD